MTNLVLDGYIVKEKTDDGKIFYFSAMPVDNGDEFFGQCKALELEY